MIQFFRMVLILFPGRERTMLSGVLALSLLAAIVETLGVASVLPFIALIVDPSALTRFPFLERIAAFFGAVTPREQIIFFGSVMVFVVAAGNFISAASVWAQQRFFARTQVRLSTDLFRGYLSLPYGFHVKRDIASIVKVMLGDTSSVIGGTVTALVLGFAKGAVALGIVALLFLHDPVVASSVAFGLVIAYTAVYGLVRKKQRILGEETDVNNLISGRTAMETLGGVKELMVAGREHAPLARFEMAFGRTMRAQASNTVISQVPRYVLETIAFGGILVLALVLVLRSEQAAQAALPMLALYGFAGYRLMPALQQVFASTISIRFYMPRLHSLYADMKMLEAMPRRFLGTGDAPEVHFRKAIEFRDVHFQYEGADRESLVGLNLVIRPHDSIGLVGRTGAGKTTLADLILGLYEPTSGVVEVDGLELRGAAVRAWQDRVGFVPQHVFLSNASIAENIAFGFERGDIDDDAVRRAAERAQAMEFISTLPDGLESVVGERGVKLSGGQRQRLGIARALYNEPEILVFDEATSALDGLTEDAVMEAIQALSGERTVILIAHRLRTVEACDRIIMLEQGRIVADGGYDELLHRSDEFKRFVNR